MLDTPAMIDLNKLSKAQLIENYNAFSGKAPITSWKKKTTELIAKLAMLKPDLFLIGNAEQAFEASAEEIAAQDRSVFETHPLERDHEEATTVPLQHPVAAPKGTKAAKVVHKAPKKEKPPQSDRGAIRRYCEEQLLLSKGTDPETKRPLGLPYSTILDNVTKKFPEAETSLNCLRWYATKMNKRTGKEKVVMPLRPKAVAKG